MGKYSVSFLIKETITAVTASVVCLRVSAEVCTIHGDFLCKADLAEYGLRHGSTPKTLCSCSPCCTTTVDRELLTSTTVKFIMSEQPACFGHAANLCKSDF